MNWTEVVTKIFEICIYPLLGLTMTYVTLYFKSKIANLNKITQDNTFQSNLQILNGIVENLGSFDLTSVIPDSVDMNKLGMFLENYIK